MNDTPDNVAPTIDLADVRTSTQAGKWLHTRAATYADAAAKATSPIDATAYETASQTLKTLADLVSTLDTLTAARTLNDMARDYARPSRVLARDNPAHWWACRHLAESCGVAGAQLATATRQRFSLQGQSAGRDVGPQL